MAQDASASAIPRVAEAIPCDPAATGSKPSGIHRLSNRRAVSTEVHRSNAPHFLDAGFYRVRSYCAHRWYLQCALSDAHAAELLVGRINHHQFIAASLHAVHFSRGIRWCTLFSVAAQHHFLLLAIRVVRQLCACMPATEADGAMLQARGTRRLGGSHLECRRVRTSCESVDLLSIRARACK